MKLRCVARSIVVVTTVLVVAGALPVTLEAAKLGAPITMEAPGSLMDKSVRAYPRLDTGLNRILEAPDPVQAAERLGYRVLDGLIQVVVVTDGQHMADMVAWLEGAGSAFVSSAWDLVQANVAPELLPALEIHPWVLKVRRPIYLPEPDPTQVSPEEIADKITAHVSEGVAAMAAGAWHSAGYTGQGIKVGVIDSQFYGYDTLSGTELPTSSKLHYQAFGSAYIRPDEVHGTGCAEVIHDVAPGAELYLGQAWTEVDIANAATWMRNQGCKVISMSLGWLSYGPGDGTGYLANTVNAFTSAGGVWANSAGNSRLAHWQGQWADNNSDGTLDLDGSYMNVNYVTTDGSNLAWIPAGTTILGSLIWNQWSSPQTDLDFFTVYWDGVNDPQYVTIDGASGEEYQTGQPGDRPNEEIGFISEADGYYGYLVKYFSGPTNVDLEYFNRFDTSPLAYNVQQGSITPPGDTASAIAAAAIDAVSPYTLESYSSKGPTNGPGGSLTGGSTKPDIAAYANVSTASYGARSSGHSFAGTSSACPHIAGAAALAWSGNTSWSASQVRTYLQNQALDMGSSGMDNDYGHGRLKLGSPPGGGGCSYSISPTSASYGSSGGSGSVSVTAGSGCSWSASSNNGWITVTGGASGSGNGTVYYSVASNSSSSSRSGSISTAGKTFSVSQSGTGGGGSCTANSTTLCLNNGRFKVRTTWKKNDGSSGNGQAVSLTNDTGYFWFFNSANVEMVLKVLKGCGVNNRYWVYAGGLTNVKVTMTVTDTDNGTVKTYNNPQSTPFQPIQDTGAFNTCP